MRRSVALGWLLITVGPVVAGALPSAAAGPTDPDQRIAFYKPRTGGPGTYMAWARLGQAYLDRGHATGSHKDLVRAEEYLEKSLAYQPNFEALRGLAGLRLEQHRFPEALELARDAVGAAPGELGAESMLFDARLALGQVDEAGAVVEGMLARAPTFEALGRRALLERQRGDLDQAIDFMGRACETAATKPELLEGEAWCLAQLGEIHRLRCEPDKAREAYARGLERYPGHALTREHLAELEFAEGRLDDALELYRSVLAERPDPQLRAALAEVYAAQGDATRADRERSAAVREMRRSADRGEWTLLRPLAFLLLDDPKTVAEGLAMAERDWKNRQDLLAADTLAWANYRVGVVDELLTAVDANKFQSNPPSPAAQDALEILGRFLNSPGAEPSILVRAATVLEATGRPGEARELLKRLPSCPSALDPAERKAVSYLRPRLGGNQSR